MGMRALRDALHPQRSLARRLLLAVFAVAALVVGLLAMHSMSLDSHNEVVAAAHSATEGHEHSTAIVNTHDASEVQLSNGCAGDCGMGHSMLTACVLALLMAVLAVPAAALLSRWSAAVPLLAALARSAGATVALPPPSLTALSISRT